MNLHLNHRLPLCVALCLAAFTPSHAQDATDTQSGWTTLFNGKDLNGWHGQPHFDPYKLAELSDDERATKIEAWTA
ncbi:MAG: DUF1080 domain-containing protein, partial [Rhodopirellula bahusiensis]